MKLNLTHAEVEEMVLSVVNNNYHLPVKMHRMNVVFGDFTDEGFSVEHDATLVETPRSFWRKAFDAATFNFWSKA